MKDSNNKHVIKSLQSNILFVAAAELIIYNGGQVIKYAVQHKFGLGLLILITLSMLKRKEEHLVRTD